jgi:hypothetical protein
MIYWVISSVLVSHWLNTIRWDPENVILIGTIPGPAETKTDQLSNFLAPLVDELLTLWETSQTVWALGKFPMSTVPVKYLLCISRLDNSVQAVKAALVICICDAPAARKLSGTQGVSGTYFCTRCWCHKDELDEIEKGEFLYQRSTWCFLM